MKPELVEQFPIGKYKGKSLLEVAQDQNYIAWLMQQPWFKEKYPQVHVNLTAIYQSSGLERSEDSPEHNRLQARFVEEPQLGERLARHILEPQLKSEKVEYLRRIEVFNQWLKTLKPKPIEYPSTPEELNKAQEEPYQSRLRWDVLENRKMIFRAREKIPYLGSQLSVEQIDDLIERPIEIHTEVPVGRHFSDVVIDLKMAFFIERHSSMINYKENLETAQLEYAEPFPNGFFEYSNVSCAVFVELKPTVGNDYASILRKAKAFKEELASVRYNNSRWACRNRSLPEILERYFTRCCVLTEEYTGEVRLETVRQMFRQAGIEFIVMDELVK